MTEEKQDTHPNNLKRPLQYTAWPLTGTQSPCCKATIIATNVITETGFAKDISFTPSSQTYCSKCKRTIDTNPLHPTDQPKTLPGDELNGPPATPLINPKLWTATIKRVIDADTVEVVFDLGFKIYHTARLRLANVDAMESNTPGGAAAATELKTILEGHLARVTTYGDKDKYGRYLCDISSDRIPDLAQWIRNNNFAKPIA